MSEAQDSLDELEEETPHAGDLIRPYLFDGDLIQIPRPEDADVGGFLPAWFPGDLPLLIYPPLAERGINPGDSVNLEVSPYHLYYGALRELAETADSDRSTSLTRLVLEWNPNAALELCELARAHVQENIETALLHYELALELDDSLYEATQDAGMCQFAMANMEGEDREERLGAAEDWFRRAVELRPISGLSWWSLARTLFDQGAEDEALDVLHQFLEAYPNGENRDLIEETLNTGFSDVQADGPPDEEQAAFQEAQALAWGQDPARAVELLTPLAEAHPDVAQVWFVLGAAHRRAGDLAEAERCLRRTVRLASQEPLAWSELTQTYISGSRWREAEDAARKCLELEADNPLYLAALAEALFNRGNREEAREALDQALDLVPDDPHLLELDARIG